jgi:voltage-gated potassium channel
MTDAALARPSGLRETFNEFVAAHALVWEFTFAVLALVYVGLDFISDTADAPTAALIELTEIGLTVLFVTEFSVRLLAAPNRWIHLQRHWMDAAALVPPIRALRALRLVRLLRVVSGARRAGMNVPGLARHGAFLSLLTTWVGLGIVLSLIVFTAERGDPTSNVDTPLDALWWGVGALTTVGSELFPVTVEGRVAAMFLTLAGAFVFSAITATITSFLIGERSGSVDFAGQLERLSGMASSGQLTADEFRQAKARVLAQ